MVRSRFEALGTYGELLLDGRPDALGTAVRILQDELAAIDLACSRFRDDSELMAVNAAAGRAVAVSELFAEAVRTALTAAGQTGGDVDPTLGRALVAAGYDADFAALPADGPEPVPAPPPPGAWRQVELDPDAGTITIPPGTALDLGATAKALAVDRAATAIGAATGAGVLVNVGGDLAAAGPLPPAGWPVRLTDDTAREHVGRPGRDGPVVRLHGGGLATSSTAVRRWRRAGRDHHHVLDPRTGRPAEPVWRTVTVTAATCVDANTASTAAIVRGRGAPDWLESLGLPSRLVDAAGAVHRVAGWPQDHEERGRDAGVSDLLGNSQLTWFLTRASGVVTLALLTISMALGIGASTRLSSTRWPRFVTQGLHRNISLYVLLLLALHVAASILDDYVRITVQESFVPFIGSYRPVWMGLGTLSSDLILALILTSLLRQRIGYETWRAVHWTSYAPPTSAASGRCGATVTRPVGH